MISFFLDTFVFYLCLGENALTHLFQNQISSLAIYIRKIEEQTLTKYVNALIFTHIVTMFINLQYLNFAPSIFNQQFSFGGLSQSVFSSNLLELQANLKDFTDCLFLLDGRFNQLRTLFVHVSTIVSSSIEVNNKVISV